MVPQSLNVTKSFSTGRLFAAGSSLLRSFCTATAVQNESASSAVDDASSTGTSIEKSESKRAMWQLYRRLSAIGATGGSVTNVLDGYIREGRVAGKNDLLNCVKELRRYKRHHHCLEVFEWMDKIKYNYSHKDHALRLDIICKTKGIDEAEKFFESLDSEEKNLYTYGALLNCYCTQKLTDKAAELFKKMEELNYVSSLTFNNLMTLALTTEEPEKVPTLVEEMKKRNLPMSSYAYGLLLQSYQQLNDMEAVERTLQDIENEGEACHWSIYSNLAAVYIRAGDSGKAEMALKKLEESSKRLPVRDPLPFHYLISFNAGLGNLAEVNRIWESLKSDFRTTSNTSYMIMVQALLKLNVIDELVKCFKEWKSRYKYYDSRIASVVIAGYLRQNEMKEAEKVFEETVEKTKRPFFRGREMFIAHYLDNGDFNLALEHFEAAADEINENEKWQPPLERILAVYQYLKKQKDVDGAEKFLELLRKLKCLKSKSYLWLLKTYVAAEKTAPDMRQRMIEDGFEITSAHEELLEKTLRARSNKPYYSRRVSPSTFAANVRKSTAFMQETPYDFSRASREGMIPTPTNVISGSRRNLQSAGGKDWRHPKSKRSIQSEYLAVVSFIPSMVTPSFIWTKPKPTTHFTPCSFSRMMLK